LAFAYTAFVNASPLVNGRVIGAERERIRHRLAGRANCDPEEITIREATQKAQARGIRLIVDGATAFGTARVACVT
jgi:hypothetical protein